VDVEEVLSALNHPTRIRILKLLKERGELTYSQIMELSGVKESGTLAFHLKKLKGLVVKEGDVYTLSVAGEAAVNMIERIERGEYFEEAVLKRLRHKLWVAGTVCSMAFFFYVLFIAVLASNYGAISFSNPYIVEFSGAVVGSALALYFGKGLPVLVVKYGPSLRLLKNLLKDPAVVLLAFFCALYAALSAASFPSVGLLRGLFIGMALSLPLAASRFEQVLPEYQIGTALGGVEE